MEDAGLSATFSSERVETDGVLLMFSCVIFLFLFWNDRESLDQPVVFLVGYSHERAVLRSGYTYYIFGVGEIAHEFVGFADAVVAWT